MLSRVIFSIVLAKLTLAMKYLRQISGGGNTNNPCGHSKGTRRTERYTKNEETPRQIRKRGLLKLGGLQPVILIEFKQKPFKELPHLCFAH